MKALLKKPTGMKPWETAKSVGVGCSAHPSMAGIDWNETERCLHSAWYEKKICKFVRGWERLCRICKGDPKDCKAHSVQFETPTVVCLLTKVWVYWDSGPGWIEEYIYVFEKLTGRSFNVKVDEHKLGWLEKTLSHIREHGMESEKDIVQEG